MTGRILNLTLHALVATTVMAAPPATPTGAISGHVVDDGGNALAGATVVLEHKPSGFRKILKSNVHGHFTFSHLPAHDYYLSVRALGYGVLHQDLVLSPGQQKDLELALKTASATVVVEASLAAPTQQGALSQDIVKTESIATSEIQKTGATNLTEAMCHRPGIDIQVECSVCNARNITLDGLPGRYTTLTFDGIPIFSSVSNAYGLDMLGVNGLERIDVSRGAGTSLITPESLAGTVSLVSKVPVKDAWEADVSGGGEGFRRETVYGAKVYDWGALSINATHQSHDSVDGVGSGVSQFTGYNRYMAGLGLFLNDLGGFRVKFRYDHIQDKKMGGPLGDDYSAVLANTSGNPFNFSAGPHGSPDPNSWINPSTGTLMPAYDDGAYGLAQIIFTTRDQVAASAERDFGDTRLHLGLGYALHRQSSWYGDDANYWNHQQQVYVDANLQRTIGGTLVTAGFNFKFEQLHSLSVSEDSSSPTFGVARNDVDAYRYRTPGVYLQAYRDFFNARLEVNASLREDDNNEYGHLTTPRLNALWHHSDKLSSRVALGTGYRLPTTFFEQNHSLLGDFVADRSQAKPERSTNFSYALNYADEHFAVTGSLNHTRITDMALFISDFNGTGTTELLPADHPFTVDNADVVGTWKATRTDSVTVGLEGYHYLFNAQDAANASLFSRPKYRASFTFDHEQSSFDFNARATFTGPQDLAKWYDYQDNPRFNLDGTPKINTSPTFWVVDMHVSWQFAKHCSAYLNLNNVFDYQQAKHDSFLFTDQNGNIDVTHIWGPGLGRNFALGVKCTF